jgi:hypothetical protein
MEENWSRRLLARGEMMNYFKFFPNMQHRQSHPAKNRSALPVLPFTFGGFLV